MQDMVDHGAVVRPAKEHAMNEAEANPAPAESGRPAVAEPSANREPAKHTAPAKGGRLLLAAAAVMVAGAGGVVAYRAQQHEPPATAALVAPPMPVPSQAPSVDNVIARLEAKLKEMPDDAQGWRMLGWSYFQTQRYAEAATALKQSIKLDPEHAETFSFLGESLVLASKVEGTIPADARAAFERAYKLNPKDARARYFKAVSMDIAGHHRKAINAWFALLKDTPADSPYADDIRAVIRNVGAMRKIEVEKRLAAAQLASPASNTAPDGSKADGAKAGAGAKMAAAGLSGPDGAQIRAAQGLSPEQQQTMIRGMVDGLEAKLNRNPDNAEGWIMLVRSRMQLAQPDKAGKALKTGLEALRHDSTAANRLREAAKSAGVAGA
jgi:cytochrome c-type biogenesis protein CcmH